MRSRHRHGIEVGLLFGSNLGEKLRDYDSCLWRENMVGHSNDRPKPAPDSGAIEKVSGRESVNGSA